MKYKLKYNFFSRNSEVLSFLQSVLDQSINAYSDAYRRNASQYPNIDQDLVTVISGVVYLEEYLFYFQQFYPEHFSTVFSNLQDKLKIVTVLPLEKRGIYGQFKDSTKTIFINPNLKAQRKLTGDERTRLYMFHELGHVINSEWMERVEGHLRQTKDDQTVKDLMYQGFALLDEVTTQDRAETMTYYFSFKNRPAMQQRRGRIFNGTPYKTNFDYYGELQEVAIIFGKTLRGIGNSPTDQEVLKKLSVETLDPKFVDRVFYEYEKDGHLEELYTMLMHLGIIKCASYALFGYAEQRFIGMSLKSKESFERIARPLKDTRAPYKMV